MPSQRLARCRAGLSQLAEAATLLAASVSAVRAGSLLGGPGGLGVYPRSDWRSFPGALRAR